MPYFLFSFYHLVLNIFSGQIYIYIYFFLSHFPTCYSGIFWYFTSDKRKYGFSLPMGGLNKFSFNFLILKKEKNNFYIFILVSEILKEDFCSVCFKVREYYFLYFMFLIVFYFPNFNMRKGENRNHFYSMVMCTLHTFKQL